MIIIIITIIIYYKFNFYRIIFCTRLFLSYSDYSSHWLSGENYEHFKSRIQYVVNVRFHRLHRETLSNYTATNFATEYCNPRLEITLNFTGKKGTPRRHRGQCKRMEIAGRKEVQGKLRLCLHLRRCHRRRCLAFYLRFSTFSRSESCRPT